MSDITPEIQRLAERLTGKEGADALTVDEAVNDAALQAADQANLGGPVDQARFLVDHLGYDRAAALLDEYRV